eukprot:SAG22_NODE_5035_length_1103_cov_0.892430_1_plen_102_part_01
MAGCSLGGRAAARSLRVANLRVLSRPLTFLHRCDAHGDRTALSTSSGDFTYNELVQAAAAVAPAVPRGGGNVAIMAGRSFEYAAATCGVWMAGATCVPMCES